MTVIINDIIKSIHERADYDYELGFEIRPSVNKVPLFSDKPLDQITTTKEQIEEWKKPNIQLPDKVLDFIRKECRYENQPIESIDQQIENIKKYGYFAYGFNILTGHLKRGKLKDNFAICFDFDNDDEITLKDFLNGLNEDEDRKSVEDLSKSYYIEHHTKPSSRIHLIVITDKLKLFGSISESSKDFAGLAIHPEKKWINTTPSQYMNTEYRFTKLAGGIDLGESKIITRESEEFEDLHYRKTNVSVMHRKRESEKQIFEMLKPYLSNQGKRHDTWLHFVGMLVKNTEKEEEEIRELVTKVCEHFNDDQVDDRLKCIESTNKRIEKGLEVSGYKGLENIMEKQDLDKLKKLAGVISTKTSRGERRRKVESDDDEDDESISEKIKKSKLQKQVVEDLYQNPNNRFIYIDKNNFYYYENGFYELDATDEINKRIQDLYGYECNINDKKQIVQFIKDDNKISKKESLKLFDLNPDILNLKNGLYNVQTGTREPHTPDYPSRIQYPFEYDEGADCPKFKKYLEYVLPDENIRTLVLRLMANTFILNNKDPYITICVGDGGRGKGVLFKILEKMHGEQNVSAIELHRLANNDSFAKASLEGKNINFDTEIDEFNKKSISALKQVASEDLININQKHEKARPRSNHAKHFFSCNSFPQVPESEKNNGWYRRVVPIPFGRDISPDMKNKYLNDEIINEELSGIFNLLLHYIKEIRNDPTSQVFELSIEEQKRKMDLLSDPVFAFIEECYDQYSSSGMVDTAYLNEIGEDYSYDISFADFYTSKKDLHDHYLEWHKITHIPSAAVEIKTFGKKVKEILKNLECFKWNGYEFKKMESGKTINAKRGIECWNGLRKKMDQEKLKEYLYAKYLEEEKMKEETYDELAKTSPLYKSTTTAAADKPVWTE